MTKKAPVPKHVFNVIHTYDKLLPDRVASNREAEGGADSTGAAEPRAFPKKKPDRVHVASCDAENRAWQAQFSTVRLRF